MLKYFEGTVFNAGTEAIVNTVNCMGVMGAGIALEFKLRYPNMFKEYEEQCKIRLVKVGKLTYHKEDGYHIINFPTKGHFKYPSKIEWIRDGLIDFTKTYSQHDFKTIAFPKLGTHNGGLPWDDVEKLMLNHLQKLNIEVIICLDETEEPQGIEADMVNYFNNNFQELSNKIKLSKNQITNIEKTTPIKRFWHLSQIQGISIKTYQDLFDFCKQSHNHNNISLIKENSRAIQTTLFDYIDIQKKGSG